MEDKLNELAASWMLHKSEEKKANENRLKIELEISDILKGEDEGTTTYKSGLHKITVTRKLTMKIDDKQYEKVRGSLIIDPVKTKYSIDKKSLDLVEKQFPEQHKLCCQFITSKPAKTAITVKELEGAGHLQ